MTGRGWEPSGRSRAERVPMKDDATRGPLGPAARLKEGEAVTKVELERTMGEGEAGEEEGGEGEEEGDKEEELLLLLLLLLW